MLLVLTFIDGCQRPPPQEITFTALSLMPLEIDTSPVLVDPTLGLGGPDATPASSAALVQRKFLSHPQLCRPACYKPPRHRRPRITYAHSPPPPLSVPASQCTAKSRLWAAEYDGNNGGLSGDSWSELRESAAVFRPGQYLDVIAFFSILFFFLPLCVRS